MPIELRRNLRGCDHPKARLHPGDPERIRQRHEAGESDTVLALEYRVHRKTIFRIVVGQSYSAD
jgi:hypothetical protein